jgi:hypothetical protein
VHQPPAYEALTNQGEAPVSAYIDYVACFNRITTVNNPIRAYSTIRIPCPGTDCSLPVQPTKSILKRIIKKDKEKREGEEKREDR